MNIAEATMEGKKTYQQIANVARQFLNAHWYNADVSVRDEEGFLKKVADWFF